MLSLPPRESGKTLRYRRRHLKPLRTVPSRALMSVSRRRAIRKHLQRVARKAWIRLARHHYLTSSPLVVKPLTGEITDFIVRIVAQEIESKYRLFFDVATYVSLASAIINLVSTIYLTVAVRKLTAPLRLGSAIALGSSIISFLSAIGGLTSIILRKIARAKAKETLSRFKDNISTMTHTLLDGMNADTLLTSLIDIVDRKLPEVAERAKLYSKVNPPTTFTSTSPPSPSVFSSPPRSAPAIVTSSPSVVSVTLPSTTVTTTTVATSLPPISTQVFSSRVHPSVFSSSPPATVAYSSQASVSSATLTTATTTTTSTRTTTSFATYDAYGVVIPTSPLGIQLNGYQNSAFEGNPFILRNQAIMDTVTRYLDHLYKTPGISSSDSSHPLIAREIARVTSILDMIDPKDTPRRVNVTNPITKKKNPTKDFHNRHFFPPSSKDHMEVSFPDNLFDPSQYKSASPKDNACLAHSIHELTGITRDQIYSTPLLTPYGHATTCPVLGELCDERMLRTFCMLTHRNGIIVDQDMNVLYTCIVKSSSKRDWIPLKLHSGHYYYHNMYRQNCITRKPSTVCVEHYPTDAVLSGGGIDIPAIVRGVCALGITAGVGAAEANNVPLSNIKNMIGIFNSGVSFTGNCSDFAKYICENVFDMNLSKDEDMSRILMNMTTYGTTLLTMPPSYVALVPDLLQHYKDFIRQVQELTARGSKDKTISMQITNLRSLLVQLMSNLPKLTAASRSMGTRVPTQIFHIWGGPGAGKTHMVSDIVKKIAPQYGVAPALYNFTKKGEHYELYAGQRFAIHDEFLLLGLHDPMLKDINCIGSPANMSIPAAFEKDQFNSVWGLFLTSNPPMPNLDTILNEKCVDAVTTRVHTFKCDITLPPGVTMNPVTRNNKNIIPRYPDYRNVTIVHQTCDIGGKPVNNALSFDEFCATVKGIIDEVLEAYQVKNEDIQTIQTIQSQYHQLMIDGAKIKLFLDPPPSQACTLGSASSSTATQHVCGLISGEAGTGKTQFIRTSIPTFQAAFPHLDLLSFNSPADMARVMENPPTKPVMAYFDDLLVNYQNDVQSTINSLPAPSLILHTANVPLQSYFKPGHVALKAWRKFRFMKDGSQDLKKDFDRTTAATTRAYQTPFNTEGIIRRSGLVGTFKTLTGDEVFCTPTYNIWYKTSERVYGKHSKLIDAVNKSRPVLPFTFCKDLIETYNTACRFSGAVNYKSCSTPIPGPYDVVIRMPTYEKLAHFCNNLKSYTTKIIYDADKLAAALPLPGDIIYVGYDLSIRLCSSPPSAFKLHHVSVDQLKALCSHFISGVWEAKPDAKIHIQIGNDNVYGENKTIYTPSDMDIKILKEDADEITFGHMNDTYVYSRPYLNHLLTEGVTDQPTDDELFVISNKEDIMRMPSIGAVATAAAVTKQSNLTRLQRLASAKLRFMKLCSNRVFKIVMIIVGVVLGAIAVGFIIRAIVKSVTKDKDPKTPEPKTETPVKSVTVTTIPTLPAVPCGSVIVTEEDKNENKGNKPIYSNVSWRQAYQEQLTRSNKKTLTEAMAKKATVPLYFDGVFGNYGILMDNETVVTVAHITDHDLKNAHFTYENVDYKFGSVTINREHDLAVVKASKPVDTAVPSLWKYLPMYSSLNCFENATCHLPRTSFIVPLPTFVPTLVTVQKGRNVIMCDSLHSGPYSEIKATTGDCGAPLLARNVVGRLELIGFIRARCLSDNSVIFASLAEDFFKPSEATILLEGPTPTGKVSMLSSDVDLINTRAPVRMDLDGVTFIGRTNSSSIPVKDPFKPSPLRAFFPQAIAKIPTREIYRDAPGPYHAKTLSNKGKVVYAQLPTLIAKQTPRATNFNSAILFDASEWLQKHYVDIYGKHTKKISPSEALNGIRSGEYAGYLSRLRLNAGAGLYQASQGCPLKSDLFEYNKDLHLVWKNTKVANSTICRIAEAESFITKGRAVNFISTDSLKSELIDKSSAEKGKIRLYQAAPIEEVLLVRRYFGTAMAVFSREHLKAHAMIGFDFQSGVNIIAQRLLKTSLYGEDGDYSNYDKSLCPELMMQAGECLSAILDDGDERQRARDTLLVSLINSVHCARGHVYQTQCGNPSGNAITTLLNCVCNDLLQVYCYMVARTRDNALPENPLDAIDWICCGDDSVTMIKPQFRDSYNGQIKCEILSDDFGMVYTPSEKDAETGIALKPLNELSFCSRRFTKLGDYWTGALKYSSLVSLMQWSSNASPVHLAQLIDALLVECASQPRHVAESFISKIHEVFVHNPHIHLNVKFPADYDALLQGLLGKMGISADRALAEGLIRKPTCGTVIASFCENAENYAHIDYLYLYQNNQRNFRIYIDVTDLRAYCLANPHFALAKFNEMSLNADLQTRFESHGPANAQVHTCRVTLGSFTGVGKASRKKDAYSAAVSSIYSDIIKIQRPALTQADLESLRRQRATLVVKYEGARVFVSIEGGKSKPISATTQGTDAVKAIRLAVAAFQDRQHAAYDCVGDDLPARSMSNGVEFGTTNYGIYDTDLMTDDAYISAVTHTSPDVESLPIPNVGDGFIVPLEPVTESVSSPRPAAHISMPLTNPRYKRRVRKTGIHTQPLSNDPEVPVCPLAADIAPLSKGPHVFQRPSELKTFLGRDPTPKEMYTHGFYPRYQLVDGQWLMHYRGHTKTCVINFMADIDHEHAYFADPAEFDHPQICIPKRERLDEIAQSIFEQTMSYPSPKKMYKLGFIPRVSYHQELKMWTIDMEDTPKFPLRGNFNCLGDDFIYVERNQGDPAFPPISAEDKERTRNFVYPYQLPLSGNAIHMPQPLQVTATYSDKTGPQFASPLGGVPTMGVAAAGLHGDLKDKAYNNWNLVQTLSVDNSGKYGQRIAIFGYNAAALSGYALAWAKLHEVVSGSIDHKITINANPTMAGTFQLCIVKEDKPEYTLGELTAISFQEFSARDLQCLEFSNHFYDQARAFLTSDEFIAGSGNKYFWVLTYGHPLQGSVSTTDSIPIIGVSVYCRLGSDFICQNALLPAAPAGMSGSLNPFLGKTISELFETTDIRFAIDGRNSIAYPFAEETDAFNSYVIVGDLETPGTTYCSTPVQKEFYGRMLKAAGVTNNSTDNFYPTVGSFTLATNTAVGWPTYYSSDDIHSIAFGRVPKFTPITFEITSPSDPTVTQTVNTIQTVPTFTSSGVVSLTMQLAICGDNGVRNADFTILNAPYFLYSEQGVLGASVQLLEASSITCNNTEAYWPSSPVGFTENTVALGELRYDTHVRLVSYTVTAREVFNTVEHTTLYPLQSMYRAAFTDRPVPFISQAAASNNATTIYPSLAIKKGLDKIRSQLSEGRELELTFSDEHFHLPLATVRIPADPNLSPWISLPNNASKIAYAAYTDIIDNCVVSAAQVALQGTIYRAQNISPFITRITNDTGLPTRQAVLDEMVRQINGDDPRTWRPSHPPIQHSGATREDPFDLRSFMRGLVDDRDFVQNLEDMTRNRMRAARQARDQEPCAAAMIVGGALAGFGTGLGQVGSMHMRNEFTKDFFGMQQAGRMDLIRLKAALTLSNAKEMEAWRIDNYGYGLQGNNPNITQTTAPPPPPTSPEAPAAPAAPSANSDFSSGSNSISGAMIEPRPADEVLDPLPNMDTPALPTENGDLTPSTASLPPSDAQTVVSRHASSEGANAGSAMTDSVLSSISSLSGSYNIDELPVDSSSSGSSLSWDYTGSGMVQPSSRTVTPGTSTSDSLSSAASSTLSGHTVTPSGNVSNHDMTPALPSASDIIPDAVAAPPSAAPAVPPRTTAEATNHDVRLPRNWSLLMAGTPRGTNPPSLTGWESRDASFRATSALSSPTMPNRGAAVAPPTDLYEDTGVNPFTQHLLWNLDQLEISDRNFDRFNMRTNRAALPSTNLARPGNLRSQPFVSGGFIDPAVTLASQQPGQSRNVLTPATTIQHQ